MRYERVRKKREEEYPTICFDLMVTKKKAQFKKINGKKADRVYNRRKLPPLVSC